jgi:retron-type reverse transcriptase
MIEKVLHPKNLHKAYRQVVANKGAAGIDQMGVDELARSWDKTRDTTVRSILRQEYRPSPIRGVEIPKANGKTRILGVPTVTDRWLQQAVSQQLGSKFELDFEEESFGFRPQKSVQKAVKRSLKHVNDGYQDIVDIDLIPKSFGMMKFRTTNCSN